MSTNLDAGSIPAGSTREHYGRAVISYEITVFFITKKPRRVKTWRH